MLITAKDRDAIISEAMDPKKVVLYCADHNWSYGSKRPPAFNCYKCTIASFIGLLANTPPARRDEVFEMLEYSVRKLIEADKRGEIDRIKLFKHPEVTFEKGTN